MTDQSAIGASGQARPHTTDDDISLWEVLAVLLRRRGTILLSTVLVAAMAIKMTFPAPDTYTTSARFRPHGAEASNSQLMALASQFGVNVPGGGSEEASPAFYAELLTSREILGRVATVRYSVQGAGTILLKDLLEIEEDTEPLRDEESILWLQEQAVSVSTGRETGTVTVTVKTEWADLSQAIAEGLLAEVSRFHLDTRQSQAATERAFIATRVEEGERELDEVEDMLRIFLEANRQWENSPLLRLQHDGLQRDVSLRQSVLTTLVQAYEQARITEVRDTPVLTVLQAPFFPPGPDDRRLLLRIALGIVLGGMLGIVLAFLVESFSRPVAGDPGREDLQRTWDGFRGSIPFMGGRRG